MPAAPNCIVVIGPVTQNEGFALAGDVRSIAERAGLARVPPATVVTDTPRVAAPHQAFDAGELDALVRFAADAWSAGRSGTIGSPRADAETVRLCMRAYHALNVELDPPSDAELDQCRSSDFY